MKHPGGLLAASGAVALLLSSATAMAAPGETGLEVGIRSGFAIPFGKADDGASRDMSDTISGVIPLWADVGYRATPNIMVGMYFMYGLGILGGDYGDVCDRTGISCGIHDVRLGAQLHYYFLPDRSADPWVGAGLGYEWLTTSASRAGQNQSVTGHGFEFFNLQAGLDLKPSDDVNLGIGPFVSFQLAQYASTSCSGTGVSACPDVDATLHQWLTLGIRGTIVP